VAGKVIGPVESEDLGGEEGRESTVEFAVVEIRRVGDVVDVVLRVDAAGIIDATGEGVGGLGPQTVREALDGA